MAQSLPLRLPWEKAQDVWAKIISPILLNAILNGNQGLNGVSLYANSAKAFPHGLNRQPQGWIVTDKLSNATVWRTAWDSNTITLEASSDTTLSVWVF